MQLRRGGPILLDDSTWGTVHPLEWRIGPRHSVGIPNQSVFIVGFKIAVNEELLHLKCVTVKAKHSERTSAITLVRYGLVQNIEVPSGPDLDTFFVGQSTLINMIRAIPGPSHGTVRVSHDVRPCTKQTTPYATMLKGGLRCRLWDTQGPDKVTDDNYRIMEQMARISNLIRKQLSRRLYKSRGAVQNQTALVAPILV